MSEPVVMSRETLDLSRPREGWQVTVRRAAESGPGAAPGAVWGWAVWSVVSYAAGDWWSGPPEGSHRMAGYEYLRHGQNVWEARKVASGWCRTERAATNAAAFTVERLPWPPRG